MWQPDPSWRRVDRTGPASAGLWLAQDAERTWVVKRLQAPGPDQVALHRPSYAGYWRREAEVALHPEIVDGPGLVPPAYGAVEEDDEGVTLRAEETEGEPPTGLFVAHALGRFAASLHATPEWASRTLLADRLELAEQRDGWPTLARTTLADVTDALWQRRGRWLGRIADGPQGRVHGDAVPANFLAAHGSDVVAVDWQCFGVGPVGSDLGYYALSSREDFEVLLKTFLGGVQQESADGNLDVDAVTVAARVTAVYSVITRAEWALARAAKGEGALAGKFRHPAVAPYLRDLQRQLPQIEHLLA